MCTTMNLRLTLIDTHGVSRRFGRATFYHGEATIERQCNIKEYLHDVRRLVLAFRYLEVSRLCPQLSFVSEQENQIVML